jgi:hypothetical protein
MDETVSADPFGTDAEKLDGITLASVARTENAGA